MNCGRDKINPSSSFSQLHPSPVDAILKVTKLDLMNRADVTFEGSNIRSVGIKGGYKNGTVQTGIY